MLPSVAVVVAVAVVAASCSSPTGQDATPNTTAPVATEATTTMAGRSVPAADWLSVSQEFGASLDGPSFRGGFSILNGSDSVIAASSLIVETVQDGVVNNGASLVENGEPLLYLTPGSNWFAFRASGTVPVDGLRLRQPEAEYADLPGTFETTIEVDQLSDCALVSGTVMSGWPTDIESLRVDIVWFDTSGKPTLGRSQRVRSVGTGETVEFELETSVVIDDSWAYVATVAEIPFLQERIVPVEPQPRLTTCPQ